MSDHSNIGFGGSSAARVIACPPSRLAVEGIPSPETEHSRRGTVLHDIMEGWLTANTVPAEFEDDAMRSKFEEAQRVMHLLLSDVTVKRTHAELRVHLTAIPGAFGTVDVLIEHHDNKVTILDYKFGDGVQVYPDCEQLHFYAAAAMTDPATKHLFNGNTTVRLVIVQPSDRGETLRVHETDVLALLEFIRKAKFAVENGHRDELLNAGDHCRWCMVKPVCPELTRKAKQALEWSDPHELDEIQIAEALDMTSELETWIKSIREYAHERLTHGQPIGGYKLVSRQARNKWRNDEDVIKWAGEIGLTPSDIYNMNLKSPAALNKLTHGDVPTDLYHKVSSGTVVAPESDKRPAVKSDTELSAVAERLRALNLKT